MLSHHYDEIQKDAFYDDMQRNGIYLKMFMDSPISEIVDPDIFYPQSSEAWNILKFLKILKTDSFINYHHQRHAWGIE